MSAADHRLIRREPVRFDDPPQKGNAPAARTVEASGEERYHSNPAQAAKPIVAQYLPTEKQFCTMQAQLALAGGYELRQREQPGGLILFEVGRHGGWRVYSTWTDVQGFAASVRGGLLTCR